MADASDDEGSLSWQDVESMIEPQQLVVCHHGRLPLAIVNYHHTRTKRSPLTDALRGAVFNTDTGKLVARGVPRFDRRKDQTISRGGQSGAKSNTKAARERDDDVVEVETKEDGTMMLVWQHEDEFIVQCRHNFGDDLVRGGSITYRELFEETSPVPVSELGVRKGRALMFEMCTPRNRVVQPYPAPGALYLLADVAVDGSEASREELDALAQKTGVLRPNRMPADMAVPFQQMDICTEGYVAIDRLGRRTKRKNPFYLAVSAIKYRGPFQGWRERQKLRNVATDEQVELAARSLGYSDRDIEVLFSPTDPTQTTHPSDAYCDPREHKNDETVEGTGVGPVPVMVADEEQATEPRAGGVLLRWKVICPCGEPMHLQRLKRDHVVRTRCHCGEMIGLYKVRCGRLLYVCSDCGNTHEAHQARRLFSGEKRHHEVGEPLGLPCDELTKRLRLHVHALLDPLWRHHQMTKGEAYVLLGQLTCLKREDGKVHVAMFDRAACLAAIDALKRYYAAKADPGQADKNW